MAKKRIKPSVKRSRTRSGCLTCRDRHIKCDEQQPVCKNCIKSKRKCHRGIRLNFTQYTIYNPDQEKSRRNLLTAIRRSRKSPIQNDFSIRMAQPFRLLDQSITIASLYENGSLLYQPYIHLHRPEDLFESDLQYQQDLYPSFHPTSQVFPTFHHTPTHNMDLMNTQPIQPLRNDLTNMEANPIQENFNITKLLLNGNFLPNQDQNSVYFEPQPSPNMFNSNFMNSKPQPYN